ncbi:MAG: thioredoxin family protein [Nitrospinota bacterium]|nr:thioredoxin family protein [Nitrospinota bacterium]
MKIEEKLTAFSLPDVSGETVSTDDLAGRELLAVIFGCNHCPYVKAYLDRIIQIEQNYRDNGLEILMINPNNEETYPADSFENMKALAKEKDFKFRYLRDETAGVARQFEAKVTPEVYLFDKSRVLRYKGRIDDCWHSQKGVRKHDLIHALDDLIANREVGVKSTTPIGCTIKWP